MNALFWVQPWQSQGQLFFHNSSIAYFLVPQANHLSRAGIDVTFVCSEMNEGELGGLDPRVKRVFLSLADLPKVLGGFVDPSEDLYINKEKSEYCMPISDWLKQKLAASYDIIVNWESPVYFLRTLYPEALILSMMPAAFYRPPYPKLIAVDVEGLYNDGTLRNHAPEIIGYASSDREQKLVRGFRVNALDGMDCGRVYTREMLDPYGRFTRLELLPLQVSNHYAFRPDTGYSSQTDYFLDVLFNTSEDTGLVVTQYASGVAKDTILTPSFYRRFADRNVIFREEFDTVYNISQILLPVIDGITAASTSLGIQSMLWDLPMRVFGNTFLKPYDSSRPRASYRERRSFLEFYLNRYTVLEENLLGGSDFLVKFVENLISRKDRQGLEKYAHLTEIDGGYGDKLFKAFTPDELTNRLRANKAVRVSSKVNPSVAKAMAAIQDADIKVVSFDIFDTLLRRPFASPKDVFSLVADRTSEACGRVLENFAVQRVASERAVRSGKPETEEISLAEIYADIRESYDLSHEEAGRLMALEVAVEKRIALPRSIGKIIWNIAKRSGKKIVLVSDMYLNEGDIVEMLAKCGYDGYDKIYLSSSLNKRKHHDGELFSHALEDLQIPPQSVLHFGDNSHGDITNATTLGIKAQHLPASIYNLRIHPRYKLIYPRPEPTEQLSKSLAIGLIANKLFDSDFRRNFQELFSGDPENLGYAGLGPLILGTLLWLRKRIRKDGIDQVFFLSRDMKVFSHAYSLLENVNPIGAKYDYLLTSRRTLHAACVRTVHDIRNVARMKWQPDATVGSLLERRFGIDSASVPAKILKKHGFNSTESFPVFEVELQSWINLCSDLSEKILENTERERDAYFAYLQGQDFLNPSAKTAIVEIGWAGTVLSLLGKLSGKSLTGYYFVTLNSAERVVREGHDIQSYYTNFISPPLDEYPLLKYGNFLEYLVCDPSGSLDSFVREPSGKVSPRFFSDPALGKRAAVIRRIHAGAIRFVADAVAVMGSDLGKLTFNPFFAESVLRSFIANPTAQDAGLFKGLHTENSFGGTVGSSVFTTWAPGRIAQSQTQASAKATVKAKAQPPRKQSPQTKPSGNKVPQQGVTRRTFYTVERNLVYLLSRDPMRREEYEQDRGLFFQTSKHRLVKLWFKFFAKMRRKYKL